MPVDRTMQFILDQVNAQPVAFTDRTPEEARRLADEGMATLARLGSEEVGFVLDRMIPGPGGDVPVRIYRPDGYGPYGVLVWFHGGGFVIGSIEGSDPVCRALCNRSRAVVVSVGYRLAPEHPFPAAVDDAVAALRWVLANGPVVHGDVERVAVGGDSAGGTLAAVVALLHRGTPRLPALRYQALVYPGTDHVAERPSLDLPPGHLYDRSMRAWFTGHYLPPGVDRADPRVSPLRAPTHEGLPPALVVTAEYDPLRDEGEDYVAVLRAAGVPVDHERVDGLVHGFLQYHAVVPRAAEALRRIGDAVGRALA